MTIRPYLPRFAIPVGLAVLTILYMAPFIFAPASQTLDGHDLVNQQYPLLSFIYDSIRDGQGIPMWNPYQFAGQSVVANPQSTLYYPPAWIMALFGVPRSVGWLVTLHLWLGAWGMAAFARCLGASRPGAFVGSVVYGFSALIGAHLDAGHFNYILCQAWLPWVAAAYYYSIEGNQRFRGILAGSAALGLCILSGYPPLIYFAGIWLFSLWLYFNIGKSGNWLNTLRPLLLLLLLGAILGAALLLPVGQFTLRSTRTQSANIHFGNSYALAPAQLLTMVVPNMFGHPRLPNQGYWGLPFYEEATAYVGILPLIAVFLVRPRRARTLLLIFIVIGFVVSLGIDGGLFPFLYRLLPGYSIFRVPSRALYFCVVGLAGMSALLITDLQQRDFPEISNTLTGLIRRVLPLCFVVSVIAAVIFISHYTINSADENPPWRAFYSGNMLALSSVAIGAAWAILWLWHKVRSTTSSSSNWLLWLTVAVIIIDIWHISAPLVNVSYVDVPDLWKLMARVVPAEPAFRVMTIPNNIDWQVGAVYTRHLNMSGYDPLVSDTTQRLLDVSKYSPASPIARLLGVRYVVSYNPAEWNNSTEGAAPKLLAQENEWHMYELTDPLPRAFMATDVQVMPDEAVREMLTSDNSATTIALVSQDIDCSATNKPRTPETSEAVKIVSYSPNKVNLQVKANQPGILVLTDTYDPDWIVKIDDKPSPLLRVDTTLRGVCLEAGTHNIQFEYHPMGFYSGSVISVISWLGLFIMASITALRQRSRV